MGSPPIPPGTGPLSPDFSGLTPELMERFIAELTRGRGVIGEHAEAIRREIAAVGVWLPALNEIREVEQWIDERLPELRRRDQLAREMSKWPGWTPALTGMVAYSEKGILPAAEARRRGRELAERYNDIDPDPPLDWDPGLDEELEQIVATLRAHALDPDLAAAFFAGLGPRRTLELPERLRYGLQRDEAKAVETISIAFGSAVGGAAAAPGFHAVSEALRRRRDSFEERKAIGDLLSAGRFPTEWLAKTAHTQVLSRGSRDSGGTLTPYLNALSRDPAAARLALALATKELAPPPGLSATPYGGRGPDRRPDLAAYLRELNDRVDMDAGSADAFGRLLASASGAHDEIDGRHGEAAARFAFTVITTADEMRIAPATRVHLAEIGGAYATEITEGANLGDDNQLEPSAFGPVPSRVPGLSPAFRLSPKDTYRFVKTFAATDNDLVPFETGMGDLARRLIDLNVPVMRRTGDPTHLDGLFAALGNVRGLELAAAQAARAPADERKAAGADATSVGSGGLLGIVGMVVPGGTAGQVLWTALSTGWSAFDTYKSESPTEQEKLRSADELETLGRQHAVAQALLEAGLTPGIYPQEFQDANPSKAGIAAPNGHLRPFSEILRSGESGLNSIDHWLIQNGMGSGDRHQFGEEVSKLADAFEGRKFRAFARANRFEGANS